MANVTFGVHGQDLSYFRRVWMQEDFDNHMVDLFLYGKDVMVMMSSEMLMTFGFDTIGDQHVDSFLKGTDQDNQNNYYVDMLNSQEKSDSRVLRPLSCVELVRCRTSVFSTTIRTWRTFIRTSSNIRQWETSIHRYWMWYP